MTEGFNSKGWVPVFLYSLPFMVPGTGAALSKPVCAQGLTG